MPNQYNTYEPFKFWCYKVLPITYDDSLSYYEVLCKLANYINNMITDLKAMGTNIDDYENQFKELKSYVDNYFTNLDVQKEINNKLDAMAQDGSLDKLLKPLVQANNATYEQQVAQLSNRLDNIIANTGDSSTEVQDARTGTTLDESLVYGNLGQAIRWQISPLCSTIYNMNKGVDIIVSPLMNLSYNGEKLEANSNRLITPLLHTDKDIVVVPISTKLARFETKIWIATFTDPTSSKHTESDFVSVGQSITIHKGTYFRIIGLDATNEANAINPNTTPCIAGIIKQPVPNILMRCGNTNVDNANNDITTLNIDRVNGLENNLNKALTIELNDGYHGYCLASGSESKDFEQTFTCYPFNSQIVIERINKGSEAFYPADCIKSYKWLKYENNGLNIIQDKGTNFDEPLINYTYDPNAVVKNIRLGNYKALKYPFPVTIKSSKGYSFWVGIFENENSETYTSYSSEVTEYTVPPNTYFRVFLGTSDASIILPEEGNNIFISPYNLGKTITVCNYNVGNFYNGDTALKEDQISQFQPLWYNFLNKNYIDILILEEAYNTIGTKMTYDSFFSRHFKYNKFIRGNRNIGILSNYPLTDIVKNGGDLYECDATIDNLTLHIVAEHLDPTAGPDSEHGRTESVRRSNEILGNTPMCIVAGDFNAYEKALFSGFTNGMCANGQKFGWLNTWPNYDANWPNLAIDNIVSNFGVMTSAYVVDDNLPTLHDHVPLFTTIAY